MTRIECETKAVELEGDHGQPVPGVEGTCGECGHSESSFGESERSVRRCLALLRENCPQGEDNYYVTDED